MKIFIPFIDGLFRMLCSIFAFSIAMTMADMFWQCNDIKTRFIYFICFIINAITVWFIWEKKILKLQNLIDKGDQL